MLLNDQQMPLRMANFTVDELLRRVEFSEHACGDIRPDLELLVVVRVEHSLHLEKSRIRSSVLRVIGEGEG